MEARAGDIVPCSSIVHRAYVDKTVDREEKIRLLRQACDVHAKTFKDCMNGKGLDRHLFALFVISKGLDYDCEFLKKCLSMPWLLSTSQAPQQQIMSSPNCDLEQFRDKARQVRHRFRCGILVILCNPHTDPMSKLNPYNTKVLVGIVDSSGNCRPHPDDSEVSAFYPPQRLEWDVCDDLKPHVKRAVSLSQQAIDDVDLHIAEYSHYGKGFIKTCKVSPDAYIQMALQITYYKIAGKHPLTYESTMTRLYLMGRTETVRSLTLEAVDFVGAYVDKTVDREEKIRLLRRACDVHAKTFKDCMNGKGLDRHLFALFVISKGLDYDCEFLKKCLSMPWLLSTSQAPQQQIMSSPNCDLEQFRDKISPGGGFGPVSDDGYGVAYMIAGNYRFYFHVSSKKSSKCTDSTLFMNELFTTLDEMKELFDGKSSNH